nr:baculoviral IAP repeat-containing protein 8-like [Cherax quadricarinatus]
MKFNRVLLTKWEENDTPRGEHKRHFPHCPFIMNEPVGNVSLEHGEIISRISELALYDDSNDNRFVFKSFLLDVIDDFPNIIPRHMPGSYAECEGPNNDNNDDNDDDDDDMLGGGDMLELFKYTLPYRNDYHKYKSRLKSFRGWPNTLKQRAEQLAEAGFFYRNLSDHVQCFYCGGGLRNWEAEDIPWNEHARWYPKCNFVLVNKGIEFIKRIKQEKPPYIHSYPTVNIIVKSRLTENDLNALMKLDIIKSAVAMNYSPDKVKKVLKKKLVKTGLPFFNIENCISEIVNLSYIDKFPNCDGSILNQKNINNELLLSSLETNYDMNICKICMDNLIELVFLPCSHMVACMNCSKQLKNCPICRNVIRYTIKPIKS